MSESEAFVRIGQAKRLEAKTFSKKITDFCICDQKINSLLPCCGGSKFLEVRTVK